MLNQNFPLRNIIIALPRPPPVLPSVRARAFPLRAARAVPVCIHRPRSSSLNHDSKTSPPSPEVTPRAPTLPRSAICEFRVRSRAVRATPVDAGRRDDGTTNAFASRVDAFFHSFSSLVRARALATAVVRTRRPRSRDRARETRARRDLGVVRARASTSRGVACVARARGRERGRSVGRSMRSLAVDRSSERVNTIDRSIDVDRGRSIDRRSRSRSIDRGDRGRSVARPTPDASSVSKRTTTGRRVASRSRTIVSDARGRVDGSHVETSDGREGKTDKNSTRIARGRTTTTGRRGRGRDG